MRTTPGTVVGDRSLLVWSDGDVMMTGVTATLEAPTPVGTAGVLGGPVLLWIDDEDDLAAHAGHHVELEGELSDEIDRGEIEIDEDDGIAEIAFEWEGEDVKARVPSAMFPFDVDDAEFAVGVRRVDVEEIRVLSAPCR